MDKLVRVVRVLEYVGTEDWVKATLENSYVPDRGIRRLSSRLYIKDLIRTPMEEVEQSEQAPPIQQQQSK